MTDGASKKSAKRVRTYEQYCSTENNTPSRPRVFAEDKRLNARSAMVCGSHQQVTPRVDRLQTLAPQAVVSVYVEPPISQPPPIAVAWAPPPMLVEAPPPMPFDGAVWIGGYWVWEGNWVWAAGRWTPPPQPNYLWVHPYYEHRDG